MRFFYKCWNFTLGSNAGGEFSVLHTPQSLKFAGSSKTLESLLKEIFSSSLGLSVEEVYIFIQNMITTWIGDCLLYRFSLLSTSTSSVEVMRIKYSIFQNSEWNGLSITDPFNTPEAVVEVYIDGVSSLGENVR